VTSTPPHTPPHNWPLLSIVVPTTGRPTLARMLESIAGQVLVAGDEVLVAADADPTGVEEVAARSGLPCRVLPVPGPNPRNDWGAAARNLALKNVSGSHVWFADDDDVTMPGALAAIRLSVSRSPRAIHLFRFLTPRSADPVGTTRRLEPGHVGTPNFVIPVDVTFPVWGGNSYLADYHFIADVVRLNPDRPVVWHDPVIYVAYVPAEWDVQRCWAAAVSHLWARPDGAAALCYAS
jgi:glycosyltransferase involved in cell wall biosynthesis